MVQSGRNARRSSTVPALRRGREPRSRTRFALVALATAAVASSGVEVCAREAPASPGTYELHDSHFHLTNYVQEGTDIRDFLRIMGTKVGRVALFGIPLQQSWSHRNSGDFAPTYYLQTDSPLYYYSFTDAYIAMAYRSLPDADRARRPVRPAVGRCRVSHSHRRSDGSARGG